MISWAIFVDSLMNFSYIYSEYFSHHTSFHFMFDIYGFLKYLESTLLMISSEVLLRKKFCSDESVLLTLEGASD